MKWSRILLLFLLWVLSACSALPGASTPADAALQDMERQAARGGEGQLVADSTRVRQSVPVEQAVYVMITYQRLIENRQEDCRMTYLTTRRLLQWMVRGAGGGCEGFLTSGTTPEVPPALSISGGITSGSTLGSSYSEVDGLVNHSDITHVRVTWNDGLVQTAAVVDQSYLVGRTGEQTYQTVEGLNAAGDVVFSSDNWVEK